MNNPDTTEEVEISKQYQLGLDLQELERSDAYRRIIGSYMADSLVEATENMIDINPAVRQESMEKVMSIGYFKQYLSNIAGDAQSAAAYLAEEGK